MPKVDSSPASPEENCFDYWNPIRSEPKFMLTTCWLMISILIAGHHGVDQVLQTVEFLVVSPKTLQIKSTNERKR